MILSVSLVSISVLLSGCFTSGMFTSANITNVELSKGNYKVVATSVLGESQAGYIFGASIGIGMYTQTFAIIPLQKDRQLYRLAMENLWKNFETKYGNPIGRKLALVNVRYDSQALNTFFYTSPKVTIMADVVEFTE